MAEKHRTLGIIYELVKENEHPDRCSVTPREIILRLDFGWDIIVAHLYELKQDGLVDIVQLNIARISLTSKGLEYASAIADAAA